MPIKIIWFFRIQVVAFDSQRFAFVCYDFFRTGARAPGRPGPEARGPGPRARGLALGPGPRSPGAGAMQDATGPRGRVASS